MSHSSEGRERSRRGVSAVAERLATDRPLQLVAALVAVVTAPVLGYAAFQGAEDPDNGRSETPPVADPADVAEEPVAAAEAEPAPVAATDPADAPEGPGADLSPVHVQSRAETRRAASSAESQDAPDQSTEESASVRGCPQPGVPGRDFPATDWQPTDDLYAHVHPEQWYISAWCAADAVAQSLGAGGWRISNWSDSFGVAVMVKSGLEDDSVFAVEYETRVVRTDRGWYVDPEHAMARYWCSRGVDVSDAFRCV